AVEGEIGRVEDHAAVEGGIDAPHALRHRGIPELELAAPCGLPVPGEVEDEIEPRVEAEPGVVVEVGMDPQASARLEVPQAPRDVRIGQEALAARELLQELQEDARVEVMEGMPGEASEKGLVMRHQLAPAARLGR